MWEERRLEKAIYRARIANVLPDLGKQREIDALRAELAVCKEIIRKYEVEVADLRKKPAPPPPPLTPLLTKPARIPLNRIVNCVSSYTGVSVEEILSRNATRPSVRARVLIYVLAAKRSGLSLSAVARLLEKDHSTIVKVVRRAKRRLADGADEELRDDLESITALLVPQQ